MQTADTRYSCLHASCPPEFGQAICRVDDAQPFLASNDNRTLNFVCAQAIGQLQGTPACSFKLGRDWRWSATCGLLSPPDIETIPPHINTSSLGKTDPTYLHTDPSPGYFGREGCDIPLLDILRRGALGANWLR
jgi:hypothetical protein